MTYLAEGFGDAERLSAAPEGDSDTGTHYFFFDIGEKVRGKDSDEHIAQPTGG